ncbi:hypothetical protein QQS21_004958 [Conoideocrella luteorostrata]|uniref:NmrA-like domain-containing protein n=1 Tax=Conoideocrella luteorostrata TaxID=1105319 RepID=A0AAJ0G192_9HYPO|nr:hypothetical protein QQS21_004958 [Conoideocrella luteorostrata]
MVKIAIAGATSELAREVMDVLAASGKHDIIALVRKDPIDLPTLPGVRWVRTNYEGKDELVRILQGAHTVLCFFAVHHDAGSETQKRLIDAAIEAGVRRYAPSEWSRGDKVQMAIDPMPWYAGKGEISNYLESINQEGKVIEYTKFQPGAFMNYLAHPQKSAKYISTDPVQLNFEEGRALVVEGSLDARVTFTTVQDIASIVARAVDYEGVWPTAGGIRGDDITVGELLKIAEQVIGRPVTIEWLKMEDLVAGELKTENYSLLTMPSVPKDQIVAFSKMVTIGALVSMANGVWSVSDEWNQLLPDHRFTSVKDFVQKWQGNGGSV